MTTPQTDALCVATATECWRSSALKLVFGQLPAHERQAQLVQALGTYAPDDPRWAGLLVALRGERLVGALWTQVQPGRTAGLRPPRQVPGEASEVVQGLLAAALEFWRGENVRIVQALLPSAEGKEAEWLESAGFNHAADVLHMVSFAEQLPREPPQGDLVFEPTAPTDEQRLASLIVATYEDSLDCPQVNGVRDGADILAAHRATGEFDPGRWMIVRHAGCDIGCLLLADHPDAGQWELVYMGLLPAARRRGWGGAMVRYAQWLTRRAGRSRLAAAVDAENVPAVTAYTSAGFVVWNRRSVFLRVLNDNRR